MTTRKCDSCKKILDKEPYYTIGEIEYTIPGVSFSSDRDKVALLSQGYVEHIAQLKAEIEEYEKIKKSPSG